MVIIGNLQVTSTLRPPRVTVDFTLSVLRHLAQDILVPLLDV